MNLQKNFNYHKARQFGQLGTVKVIINSKVNQWLQDDRRLGDGKYSILVKKEFRMSEFKI